MLMFDVFRFTSTWYVIAHFKEQHMAAHNAID